MTRKDYEDTVAQLSAPLKSFIEYEEGEKIRKLLSVFAKKNYIKRWRSEVYLSFIKKHIEFLKFEEIHAQESNRPYVYQLFTIPSQHVYGNCFEECIDNAMETIKNRLSKEKSLHTDLIEEE